MKKLKFGISIIALALFGTGTAFAADGQTSTQQVNLTVGGASLIRAVGNVGLSLNAGATEAGESLMADSANTSSRMRISSLTSMNGSTEVNNQITAKISAGSLYNTHTSLFLRLLPPTTAGLSNFINYKSGTLQNQGYAEATALGQVLPVPGALLGTSASQTNNTVTLARGIGFCWSGTGADDGYVIEYTYASTLDGTPQAPAGGSLTVTYTIAAEN